MKAIGVLIGIALALALQTTLARFVVEGTVAVDFVLVAVVYVALIAGPVGGMFAGTAAGLIQDALSTGVIGIGGLAKSIVGFLVGAIGQQFIVTATLPRLLMVVGATALHALVFTGLYVVVGLRTWTSPWPVIGGQALGNALVAMVSFWIIEAVPEMIERRRSRRR